MAQHPKVPLDPILLSLARATRQEAAPAEQPLLAIFARSTARWLQIPKQHMVGAFVADFCCHAIKLVVELDGDTHAGQESSDGVRTMMLRRSGYSAVRCYTQTSSIIFRKASKQSMANASAVLLPSPLILTFSRREKGPEGRDE